MAINPAERLVTIGMPMEQAKEVARQIAEGSGGEGVESVNGETGAVVLSAADVGALPDTYTPPAAPVTSVNGETGVVVLDAAAVGALPDDYTPPAPTWASVTGKPTTFAPITGTAANQAMPGNTTIPAVTFATVSALTGDWRGEGSETLLAALTALQAGITP